MKIFKPTQNYLRVLLWRRLWVQLWVQVLHVRIPVCLTYFSDTLADLPHIQRAFSGAVRLRLLREPPLPRGARLRSPRLLFGAACGRAAAGQRPRGGAEPRRGHEVVQVSAGPVRGHLAVTFFVDKVLRVFFTLK